MPIEECILQNLLAWYWRIVLDWIRSSWILGAVSVYGNAAGRFKAISVSCPIVMCSQIRQLLSAKKGARYSRANTVYHML